MRRAEADASVEVEDVRVVHADAAIGHVAADRAWAVGTVDAGMRTAFINRRGRPFGMTPHAPDLVVADMRALADAMA